MDILNAFLMDSFIGVYQLVLLAIGLICVIYFLYKLPKDSKTKTDKTNTVKLKSQF